MTNPDELERAVERAEANLALSEHLQREGSADETGGLAFVINKDLRLILSANREMRAGLEAVIDAADSFTDCSGDEVAAQVRTRARSALTTQRGDGW